MLCNLKPSSQIFKFGNSIVARVRCLSACKLQTMLSTNAMLMQTSLFRLCEKLQEHLLLTHYIDEHLINDNYSWSRRMVIKDWLLFYNWSANDICFIKPELRQLPLHLSITLQRSYLTSSSLQTLYNFIQTYAQPFTRSTKPYFV